MPTKRTSDRGTTQYPSTTSTSATPRPPSIPTRKATKRTSDRGTLTYPSEPSAAPAPPPIALPSRLATRRTGLTGTGEPVPPKSPKSPQSVVNIPQKGKPFWESESFHNFINTIFVNRNSRATQPEPVAEVVQRQPKVDIAEQRQQILRSNKDKEIKRREIRDELIKQAHDTLFSSMQQQVVSDLSASVEMPVSQVRATGSQQGNIINAYANSDDVSNAIDDQIASYLSSPEIQLALEAQTEQALQAWEINESVIAQQYEIYRRGKENEALRNRIHSEIAAKFHPPPGVTKEQAEKIINQQVNKKLEVMKPPRYFYINGEDGKPIPVFMTPEDERKARDSERNAYRESIADRPLAERIWLNAKYDLIYNISNVSRALAKPALWLEETITDDDPTNVLGNLIETGLNAAVFAGEWIAGGVTNTLTPMPVVEAEITRLISENNPANKTRIARLEKQLEYQKTAEQRIRDARQAMERAWAETNNAREYIQTHDIPHYRKGSTPEEVKAYEEQKILDLKQAREDAATFREAALVEYNGGKYDSAVALIQQAQSADRKTSAQDPYGAYTWVREPEREKRFLLNTALAEIQKGSPLTVEEIRMIKEHDVNANTELLGQSVFDPLNLFPAALLEDIVRVPMKLTGAIVENVPVMGSVVKWLKRPTVVSAGNKIADVVHNNLQQVARVFNTTEDVEKAIDTLSDIVMQAKRLDPSEAEKFFELQRTANPALQNLSYRQFKSLMSAGDVLDPTLWASSYRRALDNAEDDLIKLATSKNIDPTQYISDASKNRRALDMMAEQFKRSYVDPHRIFNFKDGMAFTDDTIAGWVSKTLRNLSGDEINEALKLNKFDEVIRVYSQTLKPGTKTFLRSANRIMEGVLHGSVILRDMWVKAVLSTPRWPLYNFADTAGRYAISGGNLWDSLVSLFTSTQKTFADELGIIPREITQSIGSAGVDVSEHVTSKLLYENYKPKVGLFSWWKEEYKRLRTTDQALAKRELLNRILGGLPDGGLKSALTWLGDGFSMRTAAILDAFPGAIRNFNDSIEFTFRLRMFHDTYYKALETLEPKFASRVLEGLSPGTKQVAEMIFRESENNPARIRAYVDSLMGKSKTGMPAEWSALVPSEVMDATRGMDATNRQLFIREFRSSVEEYLQTAAKNGRKVTGDDLIKFVDDYSIEMKNNIQAAMSQTYDVRNATGTINKNGKATKIPTQADLQGSAPIPPAELPRSEIINKATSRLKKGARFQKTVDIAADLDTAIADYARVVRVPGEGIRRTVGEGGQVIIEIGDNVMKGKPAQMYSRLNETLMDIFKHTDEDVILRGGFVSVDEFDDVTRKFLNDPGALLRDNERQFMTVTQQLTNHPQLRTLIEQTGGKPFKFDSLMDVYRKYGTYDNAYGFYRPIEEELEDIIQKKRPLPGRVITTSTNEAQATASLSKKAEGLTNEALKEKIGQFREQWYAYRQELHTFYRKVYPGPLTRDIGGVRRKTWDIYYNSIADAYEMETKIKNTLLDLLDSDPLQAQRYIDDALNNFSDYFLRENGIKVVWDPDHQKILDVTVNMNGRTRKLVDPLSRASIESYFYQAKKIEQIIKTPTLRVDALGRINIKTQLTNALRDTFDLSTAKAETWAKVMENHAQLWARETGQDISKYFERIGFRRTENLYGLASKNDFRILKRGAVQREGEAFIFYGLGSSNFESMVRETGELFFDDMISMAEHSTKAADDLKAVKMFIEEKTGMPVLANKLNKEQGDVFTELFTRYVSEGQTDSITLKPAFEKFKSYLATTFDAVHTADIPMSDDIYKTLNRLFIEDKMMVKPTSNVRSINIMAKEAGFDFADDEELLKFINERTFAPPDTTTSTPIAREVYQNIKKNPELAKKLGAELPTQERRVTRVAVETDLRKSLYQRTLDNWDNLTKEEQKLTGASKWIDEATGLENKNAFLHDAIKEKDPPPGTYNTLIDANSLTALNFHGGHGAGDVFIKEIGHQISEVVDEILGKGNGRRFRFGGDEFVIWHEDPEMGRRIGEALDERFKQVKIYVADDHGNEVMIEGLSISHGTGENFDVADKLLYENKVLKSEMGLRPPIGPGVDKNTLPPGLKFTAQEAQPQNIPVGDAADLTRQAENRITKKFPEVGDNYRRPLNDFTDILYRETSPEQALELIPGSNVISQQGDLYFSNTPDLALGQGSNKGVLLEFNSSGIEGQVNRNKPTWDMLYKQNQAEFLVRHTDQKTYQSALQSITIKKTSKSSRRLQDTVRRLEEQNWVKEILSDGSIKYTRPENIPAGDAAPSVGYTSLADVPKDVAQRVFGTMETPFSSTAVNEINEAWEVWKTQRAFTGFPESALVSPDTFKAYLTERIGKEWSEVSWHYNRMLADVESFETAVMNYHAGSTDALKFNMRVPDSMLSDGQKVWIRNNESMISNYESALQALEAWKPHLKDLMDGKSPMLSLTKSQLDELSQWSVRAARGRAEMMDVAMNGGAAFGKNYEGAINKTNRFMIDYQHTSIFDQYMKNVFPFWKFPSRSIPFWIETMASHPQLIAAYEKVHRMSRTQRYQSGAITSSGKPLPSLDGYVKLPGTDMWFNPLAPFSFRYVLDAAKHLDDLSYRDQEDVEPKAFLAKEILEVGQIYGFSAPPWIAYTMKAAFNLPDEVLPAYPLTPLIGLNPRWFVKDMINKANKINFGGTGLGDMIYPEVSWHDYLVEQRIYENTLQKLQNDNLPLEERDRLRKEVTDAIKYRNNDLWNSTYKEITTDASLRNLGSFFTGIYAPEFSDAQADLRRLKFDNNLLKSAINNEFQSIIFNLPDAEQKYYDQFDTDEGWLYRLYTESGWVKDDTGSLVTGAERAKWLAIHIEENEYNEQYHDEMSGLHQKYAERLSSMPIGTPYSEMKPIYEWYQEQRQVIKDKYTGKFPVEKQFYTNKSANTIQQEMRSDYFQLLSELKPVWKPESGETYQSYQLRVQDWYEKLPEMASQLVLAFQRQGDTVNQLSALQKDQQLDPAFFKDLISQTNRDGVLQWRREKDDILDAMNNAWETLYWNVYWESGVLQKGYAGDLAEKNFEERRPAPTAEELYRWINQEYGDRFTLAEVQKIMGEAGELSVQERQQIGKPEDYQVRQGIWDMLSWLGPGGRNQKIFNETFEKLGGDPDLLTAWYVEGGQAFQTKPESLTSLSQSLKDTMSALSLKAPQREELVRYVQAQDENEQFKHAVKTELGEGFYDWTDEQTGETRPGLLSYYSELSSTAKKDFRRKNPDEYSVIKDYYRLKEKFGDGHPVWNDYYGFDAEPSVSTADMQFSQPTYTGGTFTAPQPQAPARETSAPIPPPRSSPGTQQSKLPYFRMPSRLPSDLQDIPYAMQNALGDKMMWEVQQLYTSQRRLSSAAVRYLMALSSRHPEWSKQVNLILDKNST